jgi:hypothetical protein
MPMPRRIALAAVVLSLAPGLLAQVDVDKLGPQVGARPPDLKLTDQHGRLQTLQSVAGPKGTMLVFFRSADW